METLKKVWYDLVARKLVQELELVRARYNTRGRTIDKLQRFNKSLYDDVAKLKNSNRALETQLSAKDPLARSIDHASRNASQQRIRDLEAQLRRNGIEPQ